VKAHVLQHVSFEGIGSIACWLDAHGAVVSYTRFYETQSLPELRGLDLIIAMGGPMSVNDESELPWLRPEKQFIRAAVARGLPVVGMCLGAQLIANALGSRVYQSRAKEIGWFPIEAEATPAAPDVFRFPSKCKVFHWHGETFDLPPGTIRLARNDVCENQAFQLGRNVIGLQFHLEITPQSARAIVENCRDKLIPGAFVQPESELLAVPNELYAEVNDLMGNVLTHITQ
jgi:GMP synthase-like glutamine amidotransferase